MKRGKTKVKWKDVCLPTYEGGLGIRSGDEFNIALMAAHIWKILVRKETLWVRWIHAYKLKNRSFWDVKLGANVSWSWRKLLSIRSLVCHCFWFAIGNGEKASAWFDCWDTHGPLISHVSHRTICSAGFTANERIKDIVVDGNWTWPLEWLNEYPSLLFFSVPGLSNTEDKLLWRCQDGSLQDFSVSVVWNTIRWRELEVVWHKLVWSPFGIPRHSIHLWIVLKKRLKTQDRLRQWDVGDSVDLNDLSCLFCKSVKDSHEHLFFECSYSEEVWKKVLMAANISFPNSDWTSILGWAISLTKVNKIDSIVARLILAASSYFVWQERNNRLHGSNERTADTLVKVIVDTVRLKLATIKFKRKYRVQETMRTWKIAWIPS